MDLEFTTPFAQQLVPSSVLTTLEDYASCARYDGSGRMLAAGRADGWCTIWDLDTQGVLRSMEGHAKAVTSVSWSRNGRFLLTSSRDWNCILWDLEEADRVHTIRFECPVVNAELHPRHSRIAVAVLSSGQTFLIDMRHGRVQRDELVDTSTAAASDDSEEAAPSNSKRMKMTVARFTRDGSQVYVGTSSGDVLVFHARTKSLLHKEKLSGSSSIKHLQFDPAGRYVPDSHFVTPAHVLSDRSLAIASNDRVVRSFDITHTEDGEISLELVHKLQDSVARMPWNGITWSKTGDFLVGGAASKASHSIYIWDRDTGRLEKILEGPREPLLDIDWHPLRPAIASVSSGGLIHIWSIVTQEKWGAYAAGFEELEENLEYEEREDEFDIEDEEVLKRRKDEEEDQDVDIISSSDHGEFAPSASASAAFDPADAADREWIEDEPDDDLTTYFPRVYPEPPEGY